MKAHYEAFNGDLYEFHVDPFLNEIVRVIVYFDRHEVGRPILVSEVPPQVLNRLEHKLFKQPKSFL